MPINGSGSCIHGGATFGSCFDNIMYYKLVSLYPTCSAAYLYRLSGGFRHQGINRVGTIAKRCKTPVMKLAVKYYCVMAQASCGTARIVGYLAFAHQQKNQGREALTVYKISWSVDIRHKFKKINKHTTTNETKEKTTQRRRYASASIMPNSMTSDTAVKRRPQGTTSIHIMR